MLAVLTTDAVGDAERSTRRCARRPASPSTGSTPTAACPPTTPCCCWPAARRGRPGEAELAAPRSTAVCADLAQQLLADAEGATKTVAVKVIGRPTEDDALAVARAVARNNLVKSALHGEDPNWGRVLAAVGTTDAVRARPAGRRDQRRLGLPRRRGRRGPVQGRPVRPRGVTGRRPRGRRRRGDGLDQRPHRGVRPRELGVLDMTARTAEPPPPRWRRPARLIEALPWLERFHGRTVVVKYGGNAMTDAALQRAFAEDMVFLRYAGLRPVVVHGGGPQITAMLDRLGIESEFRAGLGSPRPRRWTSCGWCSSARCSARSSA